MRASKNKKKNIKVLNFLKRNCRLANGTMEEVAGSLMILIPTVVFSLLFTLCCGIAIYYKLKMAFALQTALRQVVQSYNVNWLGGQYPTTGGVQFPAAPYSAGSTKIGAGLTQTATAQINNMFQSMGLPKPTINSISLVSHNQKEKESKYTSTQVGIIEYLQASVSITPTIGRGNFLPETLKLTEIACSVFPNTTPIGMHGITFDTISQGGGCMGGDMGSAGSSVYLPCYGAGVGPSTYNFGTPLPIQSANSNAVDYPYWALQAIIPQSETIAAYQSIAGGPSFFYYSYPNSNYQNSY